MNSPNLSSTVDEITAGCERFRILVLGNSGCGKSSLINRVFGLTLTEVSHKGPGHARIDEEFRHDSNNRFVLHDSEGFLSGETKELTKVQNFITQRTSDTTHIQDRLHALWICSTTPSGNTRFTETGVNTIFEMMHGKLPIIVVLTKYDDHVNSVIFHEHIDTPDSVCQSKALKILDEKISQLPESCMLRAAPVAHVSIKQKYQESIQRLIQMTDTEIQKHEGVTSHTNPTSLVWAIAQRADPVTSIKASIDVGRARYWSGLNASTDLTGRLLQTCLTAIHNDIVTIWNTDTSTYLKSDDFKGRMSHLVDDLSSFQQNNTQNPTQILPMVATFAGAVTSPLGIAIAATGAFVGFAKWVSDVYRATPENIARFMAYIVDLTAIMYRLCKSDRSSQDVLIVLCEYIDSGALGHVHNEILTFVRSQNVLRLVPSQDLILEEVRRLIDTFCDESLSWPLLESSAPMLPPPPQDNYLSASDERLTSLPPSTSSTIGVMASHSQSLVKMSAPVSSVSRTLRNAESDTILSTSTIPAPPLDQPITPDHVADPAAEHRSPTQSSNRQISPRKRTIRQRIAHIGRAFARAFSFKFRKSRRGTAHASSR